MQAMPSVKLSISQIHVKEKKLFFLIACLKKIWILTWEKWLYNVLNDKKRLFNYLAPSF